MNEMFWLILLSIWAIGMALVWLLVWRSERTERSMLRSKLQHFTHPGLSISGAGTHFVRYERSKKTCIEYFATGRAKRARYRTLAKMDDVKILEHGSAKPFDWLNW